MGLHMQTCAMRHCIKVTGTKGCTSSHGKRAASAMAASSCFTAEAAPTRPPLSAEIVRSRSAASTSAAAARATAVTVSRRKADAAATDSWPSAL